MNRSTLARRYAPLAVVIAVQLLLVAVVPSTASKKVAASNLAAGQTGPSQFVDDNGNAVNADGTPVVGDGTATGPGSTGANGPGAARQVTGSVPGAPPGVTEGDTTHCVSGHTFDPALAYYAPPCVPGTPGGAFKNNGGKTYRGVTPTEITIVDYVTNYGAEVNAILEAQHNLIKYEDAKVFDKAIETFVNKHYVLFGRKLKIITYQGQCTSVPPDTKCLFPEMERIVASYNPYAVFWSTTLCSECFAKIAQQKAIAFGGIGFSDKFANDNAPYFYNAGMSATRIQKLFAEWWCSQMSSKNVPSRTAKFALHSNPAQDFNGQRRELGVISTNDPDNQNTVEEILFKELERRCGEKVTHTYYYAQDINTAATQVQAGIAAMDTPNNPATTVLCLCDSVAPSFVYQGEQNNNYFPENVLGDVQNMGYDNVAQAYGAAPDGSSSLACPKPPQGCPYDGALGVVDSPNPQSADTMEGVKIFKDGGGGTLPQALSAFTATNLARSYLMMANLMQNTGPNLTPENMAARASALPAVGGGASGQPLLAFPKGSWNWVQDARVVYWNKSKASPYNQVKGAYVNMGGSRYSIGSFPAMPNGPDAPPATERK
ncbi:MAG: hypothetical protein QOK43_2316 [Acidimicrobiaceae bacterium]|nr:hypothetical protein [Acidimicrobiaceae bacterium]